MANVNPETERVQSAEGVPEPDQRNNQAEVDAEEAETKAEQEESEGAFGDTGAGPEEA
jgi:hypothetical protein